MALKRPYLSPLLPLLFLHGWILTYMAQSGHSFVGHKQQHKLFVGQNVVVGPSTSVATLFRTVQPSNRPSMRHLPDQRSLGSSTGSYSHLFRGRSQHTLSSLSSFRNQHVNGDDSAINGEATSNNNKSNQRATRRKQTSMNKFVQKWINRFIDMLWNVRKWWRTWVLEGGHTIYVLECEEGKYYVGSTSFRKLRYQQHFESKQGGSVWTKRFKPIRVLNEYRRVPPRYSLGLESQVTAEYMWKYGVNEVRGSQFSQARLLTTDDTDALVSFLGHFNDLSYNNVREVLRWSLPRASNSNNSNNNSNKRSSDPFAKSTSSSKTVYRNAQASTMADYLSQAPEGRRCFHCGQYGHLASDCPTESGRSSSDSRVCFRCGETGHLAADCSKKDSRTCYKCGLPGHIAADCPNK